MLGMPDVGAKRAVLIGAVLVAAVATSACKPSGPDKYGSPSLFGGLNNPGAGSTITLTGNANLDLFNTPAANGINAPLAQTSRTGVSHTLSAATGFDRPTSTEDVSPDGGNAFEIFIEPSPVTGDSQITLNTVGSLESGLAAPASENPLPTTRTIGANDPFRAELTDSQSRLQSIDSFNEIEVDANLQLLQDTQYGIYTSRYARNSLMTNFNFFSTGNATQAMPLAGNATYRGTFYGYASTPSSENGPRFLEGDTTLVANFGSGAVAGLVDNIRVLNAVQTLGTDIVFDGNITGNQFVGQAAYAGGGASTRSGSSNGQFNGVGATEVGGSVLVQGNVTGFDPNGLTDTTTVGSFGAVRQP